MTEAEQAWSNRSSVEASAYPAYVIAHQRYLDGISDFKASLKEAIEKEIKKLKTKKYKFRNMSVYDLYAAENLEKVLELLETVKPKE